MWRSYYSRERVQMYSELTELLQKQYKLRFWRRQLIAYYAAKAAFVFKDGKQRAHYEKALPDLEKFYGEIRDISTTDFDARQAAKSASKNFRFPNANAPAKQCLWLRATRFCN